MAVLKNKMHVRLILIAILTVLLLGAKGSGDMVLTVVNKAGMDVAVSLVSVDLSRAYYITIPTGSRGGPTVQRLTLPQDSYRMRVFWLEDKDPETGRPCRRVRNSSLLALRNIRVVIGNCDQLAPTPGEPTMYKYGRWRCME